MKVLPHRMFVYPRAGVATSEGPDEHACTTLRVEGLLCGVCAARVQSVLESLPGVRKAQVDWNEGNATVEHDRTLAETRVLVEAVESAVVLRPLRRVLATFGGPWRDPGRH